MKLIVGSRGSKLAIKQTEIVLNLIKEKFPDIEFEIKKIKTKGDKIRDAPLAKIGGKGIFVKEIDEALLRGEIDFAVHSMKDVPSEMHEELELVAVPKREEKIDVLISRNGEKIDELREGAVIGTSSIRRRAMILSYRGDLEVRNLRGNLDTRLKKLFSGEYDAIVVAKAGLIRMNLTHYITQELDPNVFLPSVGQGAIAVVCRKDFEHKDVLKAIEDRNTRIEISAERKLLETLRAGCQVPFGVYTWINGDEIAMKVAILSQDGKKRFEFYESEKTDRAEELGRKIAEKILNSEASELLPK